MSSFSLLMPVKKTLLNTSSDNLLCVIICLVYVSSFVEVYFPLLLTKHESNFLWKTVFLQMNVTKRLLHVKKDGQAS